MDACYQQQPNHYPRIFKSQPTTHGKNSGGKPDAITLVGFRFYIDKANRAGLKRENMTERSLGF
jgi:hypothetical protein